ncbi:hypothetical protein TGARI_304640A, partial [Toxoplasma gondii ARI]
MAYYREHIYLFVFGICRLLQRRNVLAQLLTPRISPHANRSLPPNSPPPPPSSSSSSSSPSPSPSSSPSSSSSSSSSSSGPCSGGRSRSTCTYAKPASCQGASLSSPAGEVAPALCAGPASFGAHPLVPYELNWVAAVRLSLLARGLIREARRERRREKKRRQWPSLSSPSASSRLRLDLADVVDQALQALRVIRACQLVRPSWLCRMLAEKPLQKRLEAFMSEAAASLSPSFSSQSFARESASLAGASFLWGPGAASSASGGPLARGDAAEAAASLWDSRRRQRAEESGGEDAERDAANSQGRRGEAGEKNRQHAAQLPTQSYAETLRPLGEAPAEKTILLKADNFRRDVARRLYRKDEMQVSLSALAPTSRAALEAIYMTKQNAVILRPGNFEKVVQLLPSWGLRQAWSAFCFPASGPLPADKAPPESSSVAACKSLSPSQLQKRAATREQLARDLIDILQLQQACAHRAGFPSWGHMQLETFLACCKTPAWTVGTTPETVGTTPETVGTGKGTGDADETRKEAFPPAAEGEASRASTSRVADAGERGEAEESWRSRVTAGMPREEGKASAERILRLFTLVQREMKKGARGVDELGQAVERAVERDRREREREANRRREALATLVAAGPKRGEKKSEKKGEKKKGKKEKIDISEWLFAAEKVLKRAGADLRSSRFFSLSATLPKLVAMMEDVYGVRLVSLRGKAWKGFGRSFAGATYLSDVYAVFDLDASSPSGASSPSVSPLLTESSSVGAAPGLLDALLVSAYGPQSSTLSELFAQTAQSPLSLLSSVDPSSFRGFLYFFPCEPLRLFHHFRASGRDATLSPSASLVAPGHAFAYGRLAPGPAGPDGDRPMTLQEMDILLQVLTAGLQSLLSCSGTAEASGGRTDLDGRSPTETSTYGPVAVEASPLAVTPCACSGDVVAMTGQLDVSRPLDVQQSFCFLSGLLLQEPPRLKALAFDPTAKGQAKRMGDDEARSQKPTIIDFLSLNGFFVHGFLDFHLHVTFEPRGATPKTLETFIRDKLE